MGKQEMFIDPIGRVHRLEGDASRIEIQPEYVEALGGLETGGKIQVLYWMHKLKSRDREILRVHPRGNTNLPMQGVFSVRSPMRPNPIGVSVVEVTDVKGNDILVEHLDAYDGSPVIDIKGAPSEARACPRNTGRT